ncbi:ubiquitin carboxyl-terminal hydrolase 15 [Halyomorpha halys]|uniref:ubiquitin carboxyl-terminal hydrolase 15 n=1 Tax=Halyomorpha halys TaxID=286706 RepID=UPI0006D4D6CD|nr:ubiquitin carboxyl-terminal hydrolase 15-like [Halyomorpha halys]
MLVVVTVVLVVVVTLVLWFRDNRELVLVQLVRKILGVFPAQLAMGEQREDCPSPEEQKDILSYKLAKSVVAGETWYLINSRWMKALKNFIGIIRTEQPCCNPGPIDNSSILASNGADLKKGLAENIDYELVPEECWKLLVTWYGYYPDQVPIERKAILAGFNYTMIEVYKVELKCYNTFELQNEIRLTVSKADSLSGVHNTIRDKYSVKKSQKSRLWLCLGSNSFDIINLGLSVQLAGIADNQSIVLEVQNSSGEWIKTINEENVSDTLAQPSTSKQAMDTQTSLMSPRTSRTAAYPEGTFKPGICGLYNLGNTCYMNSVVQCLSNSYPVTNYFLEGRHLIELNVSNPLGMHGEIARAYGELIHNMWSGRYSSANPLHFKVQVGKFNGQFCGCAQHDAQELLTFLLDGLHEDLNRIVNKPYIPNKDYQGEEDQVFALQSWNNYKLRNDSIIVDNFHGLLKSRVICPHCEYLSVAFDPFSSLSLPLPINQESQFKVKFIPYDPRKKEMFLRVSLSRRSLIRDLCHEVALKTSCDARQLVVADLNNGHFHRFYSNNEPLEIYEDKELFHVFQLGITYDSCCKEYTVLPVCFWEKCKPTDKFSFNHLFGMPLLVVLPMNNLKKDTIIKAVFEQMNRHFFGTTDSSDSDPSNSSSDSDLPPTIFVPPLYLLDIGVTASCTPVRIEFDDDDNCVCNIAGLVNLGDTLKLISRKILLVQLTVEQKQMYYTEKSPDYGPDFHLSHSRDKPKLNISDCFDLFTTCEKLGLENTWYCPTCKKDRRVTKKFDLWKLPNIFIIQLKRFSFTKGGDKIDSLVEFPLSNLRLTKYIINPAEQDVKYDLIGVINHYGTLTGGHYTAYCKNKTTNRWYCFDDDNVSPIRSEDILSPAAYVLFYQRNSSLPSEL